MEQDNEKIIYDIEVRTKIDEAQKELRKLKQELKNNNKEELLVNLKIIGNENFNSIKQNLNEVRKAIEILEKHSSTTLTLNGAGFDITLNKLRALEKDLEDFQKQVNKGNLNNQIKEQQKLQNELEKTVAKFNKLKDTLNMSFSNNKALSEKELNRMVQQANDYANKINSIYKQMGMNMKVINPFEGYSGDYSKYFNQSKEKVTQELKQIEDAKVQQARQANAQIVKDEQDTINKNTQAHKSAWEAIANAEKEQALKTAQNRKAINDYYKEEEKRIKQNSNSHKQAYQEWAKQETSKEKQIEQNRKNLNSYYSDEEKRIKENSTRSKQAYQEWAKEETLKEKQIEQNRKNLDKFYADEEKRIQENSNRSRQAYTQITDAINKYNNILDSVNKKKQLGIQLSEQEYASVQKRLQNASNNVASRGGVVSELPVLQDRTSFNKEARGNYFANVNSQLQEAISLSTTLTGRMSALRTVYESAYTAWIDSGRTNNQYKNIMTEAKIAIDQTSEALQRFKEQTQITATSTDKFLGSMRRHLTWILSSIVASVPLVLPGYGIDVMKDLESRFATVEQVMPEIEHAHKNSLDETLPEAERMKGLKVVNDEMESFIKIGKQYGVAVEDVIEAGASIGRMYGQGENGVINTNLLTQQAARISVADNFPMLQATKGLESALSQFGLQTDNTNQLLINSNRILDVWTMTAHNTAASAKDLTEGVSLAGAAAHQAGVSFEFLNSLIATGVRNTGRSGNEIGNTIKSFINSMQSDKSVKALEDFGITMYKDNGDGTQSLRSMEDVILDISRMMQTTEKETSKLLLTLSGGKYQVSKMTAILKDYKELVRVTGLLNSDKVQGFTDSQITIQLETFSRKVNSLSTNIKGLFADIGNNGGLSALKNIVDALNNIITGVRQTREEWGLVLKSVIGFTLVFKGIPLLLDTMITKVGKFKQTWDNAYNSNKNITAKSTLMGTLTKPIDFISDSYNKGKSQATNIFDRSNETDAIKANTEAEQENIRAKQEGVNVSSAIITTNAQEANVKNQLVATTTKSNQALTQAGKIAKNFGLSGTVMVSTYNKISSASQKATFLANVFNKTVQFGSTVISAFGGWIGIAVSALTLLIPYLLTTNEEFGELANKAEQSKTAFDEWNASQEETYNRQIRASESAKNLARIYNDLQSSLSNCAEGSKEYKEIDDDLQATKDALIDLIGEENIAVDENGKIKIDTINKVADSADEAHLESMRQKRDEMLQEKAVVDNKIETTKAMLQTFKQERDGLGLLEQAWKGLGWSISSVIHKAKAGLYAMAASRLRANSAMFGGEGNAEADKLDELVQSETSEAERESMLGLTASESDFTLQISNLTDISQTLDSNLKQNSINYEEALKNSKNTGGADSNRGDKIAEPPKSSEDKKKSKAEKEAEKLAKQQADYQKVVERVALVADEKSRLDSLKSLTSSGLIQSGALISSGNADIDRAIAQASIKYGVDENWIHALVQKESSYNVRTGQGTPYKGLTQVSDDKMLAGEDIWNIYDNINAGVRHFKKMLDLANGDYFEAYVKYNEGENGSHSNEAVRNATVFKQYHDNIMNGTSDFGSKLELPSTTNLTEATQWADQMVADGKYYGASGCTAFVKAFLGEMNSSFADTMDMYVPDLYNNVKNTDKFLNKKSGFKAGDIVITDTDGALNEPDHVVIADGYGGYYGNSTSQKRVVHGSLSDFNYIWGGVDTGANSGGYSTGFNDAQFVKDLLSTYGIDDEKMYNLRNVKDISMMLKMTDAMGMNIGYSQKTPIAGDILYTKDGKAFVVNSSLGYTGINGVSGKSWKDIPNLTDTFTSFEYAMGLTLENAGSKIGKLKLSDTLSTFINGVINKANNDSEKFLELIEQQDKEYSQNKTNISNRKSLYGNFDFEANNEEYKNEEQQYQRYQNRYKIFLDSLSNIEQKITEYFNKGVLKDKLANSGIDSWKDLSNKQLQQVAQDYSKAIGDNDLENLVTSFKDVKDKADEANNSMKASLLTLKQFQGVKTPQQQLEYELDVIDKRMSLWKSNYAMFRGGSYDGLAWQTNKVDHENTVKQIKLYSEYLAKLNAERDKYIASGSKYKERVEEISQEITTIQTKLNELQKKSEETSSKLTKENKETVSSMLYDWIKGSNSLKDIWLNLWNEIAKIAIDRLVGIKDSTNSVWDLVSNVFGFGKPKLNIAEKREAERYVDNYNSTNDTIGKLAATSSKSTYSAEGTANFYAQSSNLNNASQNMLLASQNMLQGTVQDNINTIQDTANTAQDTANAVQFSTTANMQEMAIQQFGGNVSTFGSAVSSFGSQTAVNSASSAGGAKGNNVGSYLGLIPSVLGLFSTGGSLDKFADGGRSIRNGGKIHGAGTGVSDSILAYLSDHDKFIAVSDGEYIMNANATRKYGSILEEMNLGKFADGGSIAPEPYVPTLKNPSVASNIIKQDAQKQNNNARMEALLGQQNLILTNIAKQDGSSGGNVTILNTRASKEEIFSELAKDPRALQKLINGNQRRGFR